MSNTGSSEVTKDAWYSFLGNEQDVVLTTRARLARNLADFVFPSFLKSEEGERVQSLVFDAFSVYENQDEFQSVRSSSLDALGQRILSERGMFPYAMYAHPWTGGVIRCDGRVTCSVNYVDHLHIASYSAGFDCEGASILAYSVDDALQERLQFAASPDFGYLTANVDEVGSGLKLSCVLHLHSLDAIQQMDKIKKQLKHNNCILRSFFAPFDSRTALGHLYRIESACAFASNEAEQIANFTHTISALAKLERDTSAELVNSRPTRTRDEVYRAIASIKYSRLVNNPEGIEIISHIKWGINLGLLDGISHHELTALLYRIQTAHLTHVIRHGNFNFESDMLSEEMKIARLRSLVLQEALCNVKIIA